MDKRQMSLAVVSIVVAFCAITYVTASSFAATPLYTVRMEQASSKMNFLPTTVNEFTYTAENGYTVNYAVAGYCGGIIPLISGGVNTCETCDDPTCWNTCPDTCEPTCPNTCMGVTCSTCMQPTCETCESTCPYTCSTCTSTCWNTCSGLTCKNTCEIDCWP